MRSPRCLTAMVVLTTLALGACGGGNTGAGTAEPTASAPDATMPPPDATQPGTTAVTPTTGPTTSTQTAPSDERGSGGSAGGTAGGGGEEAVRVPASFVATAGGRLTPPTITVPPFLAVEVSVLSSDGKDHRLTVQTPTPHTLRVATGRRAAVRIPGLRAGRYPVLLDGRRAGALIAGGEVGP